MYFSTTRWRAVTLQSDVLDFLFQGDNNCVFFLSQNCIYCNKDFYASFIIYNQMLANEFQNKFYLFKNFLASIDHVYSEH